ncbi:NAC domain-containing protein 82-like isoform X1 [Zingiber officinale]|uniref:NAC domain-containing protein 82-like isoform X1 n=1 Tax=Zingiber officinale TaxID=94328 RepID=UPI001C4CE0F0|nr:NAC domain-containing protein 82-like isoform X1 [Zingiber officinale]XP_042451335.1 NAC domain-containing protein 82-like isoform X1 [Zingiber officinale]
MAKNNLPPGFRFHPTDVELVWFYLKRKIMGKPFRFEAITEIELYKFAPWDLPGKSQLHSKDLEWYFFCARDRKYPNGSRANRTTGNGYWKATGNDKVVVHNSSTIGMRKSLVFHVGKLPKGSRTDWMMYEYRLESKELVDAGFFQDAYVLCKIFQKSGSGPKIGEQYGAPFNEEDYDDDTTTEDSFPLGPESLACQTTLFNPVTEQAMTSAVIETSSDHDLLEFDGILLDEFLEFLNSSPPRENAHHEVPDSAVPNGTVDETSSIGPEEISTELENIYSHEPNSNNKASGDNLDGTALSSMLLEFENDQYLELTDFWLTEDNTPCQSTMLNDALTCTHNNLVPMPDSVPYFSNDGSTSMHYASYAGAEITNGQPTINVQQQTEDVGIFAYHPDALESESLLASFTNPFL